ncbi:MAG: hypothetical protein WCT77_14280 [Bacteroidota bacterium]
MQFKNLKYRFKLFFAALVILLVGACFAAYFATSTIRNNSKIEDKLRHYNTTMNFEMQKLLEFIEQIPEDFAFSLEYIRFSDEDLKEISRMIVSLNEEIYGNGIVFEPKVYKNDSINFAPYFYRENGKIKSQDLGDINYYNYWNQDWYIIPKKLGRPEWIEPYYDTVAMTTYSVPFWRHTEDSIYFGGIITVDLSLDWLNNYVNNKRPTPNSFHFIVSKFGTLITFPNKQYMFNENLMSLSERLQQPVFKQIAYDIQKDIINTYIIKSDTLLKARDTKKYRILYSKLKINDWWLFTCINEEELLNGIFEK